MALLSTMIKYLGRLIGGLLIICLLLITPLTQSYPNGADQKANDGCLCHGSAKEITQVEIIGLPDNFESNTSYPLTISISSEIESVLNSSIGGFRLLVSQGEITFQNQNRSQSLDYGWTHTEEGSKFLVWNFTWLSPNDNTSSVEFKVFGNAVNGNNDPYGDAWNYQNTKVGGVGNIDDLIDFEDVHKLEAYEKIMLGSAITALLYLAYIVIK